MRRVTITTPARLHFALIDLNGALGRIDGSIGLAIDKPHFQIVAEASNQIQVESVHYQERARGILERLQTKYGITGVNLKLHSEIPAHAGFGSGTQLALGIAQSVNLLYGLNLSVSDLARAVARGGTSGIGLAAFENGGFILDGGHSYPDQKSSFLPSSAAGNTPPPPTLLRRTFPDWDVLIAVPNCTRISGQTEVNLFRNLCPQPQSTAERLSHLILLKLLPAIVEKNLPAFGEAINCIQRFGWKQVEIEAQGETIRRTLNFLWDNGAVGAGVSSWGPAIFAVGENLLELQDKTQRFLQSLSDSGTCFITKANNTGARVEM